MAVDLSAEVKRRKIADSLTNGDDESDTTNTGDEAETTDSDKEETTEEPAVAPTRQEPSPVQTFSDYSAAPAPVASSTPTPSVADRIGPFTHAIAEDQPVADYVPAPAPATVFDTESKQYVGTGAAPPPKAAPTTVFDTESKQYVGTGEPPAQNLEPLRAESVVAQPARGTSLAELAALQQAGQYAGGSTVLTPETAPSVGLDLRHGFVSQAMPPPRAELVPPPSPAELAALQQESQYEGGPGLPGHPTMVPRAQLARVPGWGEEEGLPVTPTPPEIKRGQLVSVSPGTAPKALQPVAGAPQPAAAQPAAQPTFGPVQTFDDYSAPKPAAAQQPAAPQQVIQQGGDTGVADYFSKRGDKPITSRDDPRLTTVTVGDQNYRVNKEAAPAFQGFLNELAAKGAPVQAGDSWVYREKVGAKGISDHAYGGAIDVNQGSLDRNKVSPAFQKWIDANPGVLQQIEKRWNIYGGERFGDLGHFEWGGAPLKQVAQQPAGQPSPSATNPDGSDFPAAVPAVDNKDPAAFIVHHTSGRGTVDGVVSTLKERGLGVEYVMDRDGNIFQTGGPGAQNILAGWGPKGTGLNNQNVVGMEIIAKDDADVTEAQKQSFARFIAARYPNTPLFGHGEVNPDHKEADEGLSAKAAALALRAGGQLAEAQPSGAPQAQPVTKGKTGFYQGEDPNSFLTGRVTAFATPEDLATGQDNGVGSPHLGTLDTTRVAGVAIPQWVLQQYFGNSRNSTAAMREARVDVVDPTTGKRLRVPIVDIGPGPGPENAGVVADMTPALKDYFGGDKNLSIKIVPQAGPDVMKNPQLFYDEQAAIKNGFDSSTLDPKRQVIGQPSQFATRAQTSEEAAQAQKTVQAAIQKQSDLLAKLPEAQGDNPNIIGLYKRLDDSVEGVTKQTRVAMQANLKPEIIAAMREKFPDIKSDDEAWKKALSDVGPLEVGAEAWSQLLGGFQQYTTVLQKGVAGTDQLHVNQFLDQVMPGATEQAKQDYLAKLYGMPINQRIAEIQSRLPQPQAGIPSTDPQQIVSALDRAHNTDYQKQQASDLATAAADMKRNLTTDPRLVRTGVGKIIDNVAQIPSFVAVYKNPVMLPLVLAQTNDMARQQLKQDHPDWDEKTISENAARATMVMFLGQEAGAKLMGAGGGALLKALGGSGGKVAIAHALAGIAGGPAIGAGTQVGVNVVTGAPRWRGVGEAALTGLIQGGFTGLVHAGGELIRPGERPTAVAPEVQPAPPTEPVTPPPRPVTQAEVTGPEVSETYPWYKPSPIVTRGEERTTFTPAELAEQAGTLRGRTPEELQAAAEKLTPPMDFTQRSVWLNSDEAQQAEIARAREAQAQQHVYPVDQQGNPQVSESEPWVSKIANRFTAERMATGELGPVEPGVGVTKEEMLARGLQMSPETIAQHVSNVMNDVGGNPRDQAAAIRTEEARLSQVSHNASLVSEADPKNAQLRIVADNAFKDLSDFHNGPVAKLKNNWHAQGMTLQGEIPVDLSSYNGLRDAYLRDIGKAPPPEMEPAMRATAARVRAATDAESAAMRNLGAEIERQSVNRRLPSDEELRQRIMERMKDMPCPT